MNTAPLALLALHLGRPVQFLLATNLTHMDPLLIVSHPKTVLPDSQSECNTKNENLSTPQQPPDLPKPLVINPFCYAASASTLQATLGMALTATPSSFLPETKAKTKKPDDQVPHCINKTSNGPKNLFAIDYICKHPGSSRAAVTQAYNSLVPDHKQVYVTLGAHNNANKCHLDLAGTMTLN
ncbi:hypothetical protein K439DRAFT_1616025 [Ramaria rubella]|nr:hypothetical protein K439DRAFT_1616025 [Ramaria rubella]